MLKHITTYALIRIKAKYAKYFKPKGKSGFLSQLKSQDTVLDVGCSNNFFKLIAINPKSNFYAIDINNPIRSPLFKHKKFYKSSSKHFASDILNINETFDYVVSSHNLEHCEEPIHTLKALCSVVKVGGSIFLSFPSIDSLNFPSRDGTLNFFDDPTHLNNPLDYDQICQTLLENNFSILYSSKNYQPFFLYFLGLILEPVSRFTKRVLPGTWAFYGFETIIHAKKNSRTSNKY